MQDMEVIALLAATALVAAFGLVRGFRRGRFAVSRYEHTYSALDAAIGRARHTGPGASAGADHQGHVQIVPPRPRRRTLEVVEAVDGEADVAIERGVSSPLAG